MTTQAIAQVENLQDSLRSMRVFVSGIGGHLVDQAMALTDASVRSSPYQYQTVTQQGAAIEGTRAQLATAPAPQALPGVSNATLLIVAAVVAVFLLRR